MWLSCIFYRGHNCNIDIGCSKFCNNIALLKVWIQRLICSCSPCWTVSCLTSWQETADSWDILRIFNAVVSLHLAHPMLSIFSIHPYSGVVSWSWGQEGALTLIWSSAFKLLLILCQSEGTPYSRNQSLAGNLINLLNHLPFDP